MKKNKPNYYNDLNKVYEKIWYLIKKGLDNRDDPFHIPVFISSLNKEPNGRIIVLRGFDEQKKSLWFHSDIRSNKINILKKNPKSLFLFYDKKEKIQLRVSAKTKIHYQDDISEKAWEKTAHMSRQCYLGNESPGSNSSKPTSGLSDDVDNSKYTLEESEVGYKNFCLVENFITSVEWLYLAAKGHRRAIFFIENDLVDKKWLIP